jgi:hypothetical protein
MGNEGNDSNMSVYPDNWQEFPYPSANPPLSQADPIRGRSGGDYDSGRSVPTDPGRAHETANIVGSLQIAPFFNMSDSGIGMQETYSNPDNWHLAAQQELPGSNVQSLNTSMLPGLWLDERYLREVHTIAQICKTRRMLIYKDICL